MATVSNLTQYFIDGVLEGYVDLFAPLKAFAYAANVDQAALNDVVRIPFLYAASASHDFTYTNGYQTNDGNINGKSVTLNIQKYKALTLNDSEFKQLSPELAARHGRQMGRQLCADFISQSWANNVTTTNFSGQSSYSGSVFTSSVALADIDKKANDQKWPDGDRYLIANTTLWNALMTNTAVVNASNFAFNADANVAQTGKVKSVYGFQPYKTTINLPNADTGFICTPNALGVAMAWHNPSADAGNVVESIKLSDPASQVVIGFRRFYDPLHATSWRVVEVLGGATTGDPNALIHIK